MVLGSFAPRDMHVSLAHEATTWSHVRAIPIPAPTAFPREQHANAALKVDAVRVQPVLARVAYRMTRSWTFTLVYITAPVMCIQFGSGVIAGASARLDDLAAALEEQTRPAPTWNPAPLRT